MAAPVTDTLRDRIAAAIDEERNRWAGGDAPAETLADAVIAELGRIYEDGLDSTVFAAIRLVEQCPTPKHFTQKAADE